MSTLVQNHIIDGVSVSGTRLFLHDSVHDPIVERMVEIANNLRAGDPFDASVTLGPCLSKRTTRYRQCGGTRANRRLLPHGHTQDIRNMPNRLRMDMRYAFRPLP